MLCEYIGPSEMSMKETLRLREAPVIFMLLLLPSRTVD
jgi:hypothetical protein